MGIEPTKHRCRRLTSFEDWGGHQTSKRLRAPNFRIMPCKKIHPRLARILGAPKWSGLLGTSTMTGNFKTFSAAAWRNNAVIGGIAGLDWHFRASGPRYGGGIFAFGSLFSVWSVLIKNLVMAGCCVLLANSLLSVQPRGEVSVGVKSPSISPPALLGSALTECR